MSTRLAATLVQAGLCAMVASLPAMIRADGPGGGRDGSPSRPTSHAAARSANGDGPLGERALPERTLPSTSLTWQAIDIDGRAWSATALQGHVVLVDFWATWCAPCLDELPRLRALHDRYADRGFVLIGVSLDRSSVRDFRSWLQRQDVRWPQIRQPGGYEGPLARFFGVEALPASYLIDRDGRVRATEVRGDALETSVQFLMDGAR